MKYFFWLMAAVLFIVSMCLLGLSKSAVHEILSAVMFLSSSVFMIGAGIIGAIKNGE